MLELQDFQISHPRVSSKSGAKSISASPSVAKRAVPPRATLWYRRLPTRSLRGVVRAPDCLNDDPVWWWWNSACDRLGWASRLVPSDHDEAPRNRFRIRFRAYSWVRNLARWLLS